MTNVPADLPSNTIYFKDLSNGYQVAIVEGDQHVPQVSPAVLIAIAIAAACCVWWLVRRKKRN